MEAHLRAQKRTAIQAIVAQYGAPMPAQELLEHIVSARIYNTRLKALNYLGWLVRNGWLASFAPDGTATTSVAHKCRIALVHSSTQPEPQVCGSAEVSAVKTPCHSSMNKDMAAILTWLAAREETRRVIAQELTPKREQLKRELAEVEQQIRARQEQLQSPDDVAAESALRHVIASQRPVLENAGVL